MLEGLLGHDTTLSPDKPAKKIGMDGFDPMRRAVASRIGPDLEITAQSLWAATHGLISMLLARSTFPWVDRGKLMDWHIAALLKGMPES